MLSGEGRGEGEGEGEREREGEGERERFRGLAIGRTRVEEAEREEGGELKFEGEGGAEGGASLLASSFTCDAEARAPLDGLAVPNEKPLTEEPDAEFSPAEGLTTGFEGLVGGTGEK